MTLAHVLMISNPGSGNNRKWQAGVAARMAAYPQVRHHVTHSPQEAEALIPGLAGAGIRVLVINGGDGTIATTIGLVIRYWPRADWPLILVLPGGTANMTAGDIGMSATHRRAMRRFYRWLDRGAPCTEEVRARHIMRLDGAADGQVRFGMFLGTGAIMQATSFGHSHVHARGLGGELSLGLILLRTLWGLIRADPRFYRPTLVRLRVRERQGIEVARPPAPMLILVASTLDRLFLGIRPFWATGDAPIGLTSIRGGAARFGRAILSVLRGRPNRHVTEENGYESFRGARIELSFEGDLNLDGELVETAGADTPLVLTAEGPLKFLCPR